MIWEFYVIWLAVISVITFILYGYDKNQSRTGGQRVPEAALHWLALLGGFSGGWAGRSVFHHRTQKGFFVFVLAISTALHLSLVFWLLLKP
jgi:uncharacterized membrane protein YsdA (DUF1294 family)